MAVIVSLQGITSGEGFLIAPVGARVFDASLSLHTDSDAASVTLQASPDAGALVFAQTSVDVTTTPTSVAVHATTKSISRGDTTIQVLEGSTVVWSMAVTCITNPVLHFRGRFQARFATQPEIYNANPMYTATSEDVGRGWTWGLEGEPSFVPPTNNVPERIETPVGRVIRFNDPVAPRTRADPVVTTVDKITGETRTGIQAFTSGDPVIGERVNLGPNTYFAGNREFSETDPTPEEFHEDANEPMGLFELHVGDRFSGASAVGPFTHKATRQNEHTRTPDSRPIARGLEDADQEMAEFGLPDLVTFSERRIDLLVDDFKGLPPGDSPERRNLARRIGHLLSRVGPAKRAAIMAAHPNQFRVRVGTIPRGWTAKQVSNGKVDADLRFQPGDSSVIEYFALFTSFAFQSHMFSFHSDELCAHHISSLRAELTAGPDSLTSPEFATLQPR
jgi:hypothetical protein